MNRKQKKELREHQSTRQLMGIGQITERGVKTAKGELVFFLVRPDNLSVLSPEGVQGRVSALADLLRATPNLRMLAPDSRESFQDNELYYQRRLEEETVPAIRDLLRQDMAHLDEVQSTTALAREFAGALGIVCGRNCWLPIFQGRLVDIWVKIWYTLPKLRRCCH